MRRSFIILLLAGAVVVSAYVTKCLTNIELDNTVKALEKKHEKAIEEFERKYKELENLLKQEKDNNIRITEEIEELKKELEVKEAELKSLASSQITVELTGYCNCSYCTQSGKGITAMGTQTRIGVIATPQEIPLGTTLYIPFLKEYKNDGMFIAEDRGGAIQKKADGTYIIDVWFPTHEQALEFGRQKTVAYIK